MNSCERILTALGHREPDRVPIDLGTGDTTPTAEMACGVARRLTLVGRDSLGVSLRAQGAEAELRALDAWQMKSIYEHDSSGAPAICLRRKHQH